MKEYLVAVPVTGSPILGYIAIVGILVSFTSLVIVSLLAHRLNFPWKDGIFVFSILLLIGSLVVGGVGEAYKNRTVTDKNAVVVNTTNSGNLEMINSAMEDKYGAKIAGGQTVVNSPDVLSANQSYGNVLVEFPGQPAQSCVLFTRETPKDAIITCDPNNSEPART